MSEGDHIYSWLTGVSARDAEKAPPTKVTETFLSLLRTVTQDASWQASNELKITLGGNHEQGRHGSASISPPPCAVAPVLTRSNWNSNPLFRGSYSYIATESSPADIEELARPLLVPLVEEEHDPRCSTDSTTGTEKGICAALEIDSHAGKEEGGPSSSARVFFAGEATHPEFFSTAHGGYETGRRAAQNMLASLTGGVMEMGEQDGPYLGCNRRS